MKTEISQNIYLPLYADLRIYIAVYSLRYNDDAVVIKEVTRERYCRMKADKKTGKAYHNEYFKRVTHTEANRIIEENELKEFRKNYDKAIMKKYNVGANYRNSRYFMEQVRPTLN